MSTATIVSAHPAQLVLADQGHNWDGPGVWWPIFPILWLLVVAAIVTTCVTLGRRHRAHAGSRAGEAKLAERFATGEITEQEYRERRAVLKENR
jgi:putative membrane protein